jgi:hypothetical protein
MNELEFRRRVFADPYDPEVAAYAKQHPEQQQVLDELKDLDLQLNDALNIAPPPDLTERLLAQTQSSEQVVKRVWFKRFRAPFATAASAMLAVSLYFLSASETHLHAGEHALEHVYHEVRAFERTKEVSLQTVNEKLALLGAQFKSLPGKATYATFCNFKGQRSLHLIVQSEHGALTIFIVPNTSKGAPQQEGEFNDNRFAGVISTAERANTILVADRSSPIDNYRANIDSSLQWL